MNLLLGATMQLNLTTPQKTSGVPPPPGGVGIKATTGTTIKATTGQAIKPVGS